MKIKTLPQLLITIALAFGFSSIVSGPLVTFAEGGTNMEEGTEGEIGAEQQGPQQGQDLSEYSYEQRQEFEQQVNNRLEEIDSSGMSSSEAARFENTREEIQSSLDNLDNVSQDNWQQFRDEVQTNLNELQQISTDPADVYNQNPDMGI